MVNAPCPMYECKGTLVAIGDNCYVCNHCDREFRKLTDEEYKRESEGKEW